VHRIQFKEDIQLQDGDKCSIRRVLRGVMTKK